MSLGIRVPKIWGWLGRVRGTAAKQLLKTSFPSCGLGKGWREGSRPEKSKEMGMGSWRIWGKGKRDAKLRASNTSLEAKVLSLEWLGNPSDKLGKPFPANKSFKVHLVCPPPRNTAGYWRPSAAESHGPGRGKPV